jgi:hypothetical protein
MLLSSAIVGNPGLSLPGYNARVLTVFGDLNLNVANPSITMYDLFENQCGHCLTGSSEDALAGDLAMCYYVAMTGLHKRLEVVEFKLPIRVINLHLDCHYEDVTMNMAQVGPAFGGIGPFVKARMAVCYFDEFSH